MTSMLLVALLVLTAIISYPELHGRIAGLEREPPGPEVQLRLAQSVGALTIVVLVVLKREWFVIGASVSIAAMTWLGLIWLEFALRIFFKRIAPRFGASSVIRSWKSSLLQFSSRMGEMSWMDPRPHPFLQFTSARWTSEAGRGLGFGSIEVKDLPKPTGVIRVACLGNSTTFDGYPERWRIS
jgi:hypothetical protein